jgi:TPP-dependent pyruvate/acetoin dehydrogenase alpha subunit
LSAITGSDLPPEDIARIYHSLRLIRRAEEEVARIYPSDKIKSPVHLSIGQESVAVGVCDALQADDAVSGTYRGHAAYIAKGGDLNRMFAELYGKATGITGGKGGSMHLIDINHHVLGTSAVVGTTVPIAAGYALAFKREGKGRVVVSFFGDGATEEGVFLETINFAALHRLPILFICENNGYAIHTPSSRRWATDRLAERVATYGMRVAQIQDADVFQIRSTVASMVSDLRAGSGPAFIESKVYRWQEHVGPNQDYDAGYRSLDELKPWVENDQVMAVAGLLPVEQRKQIEDAVEKTVMDAVTFAENSPFPDCSALEEHVFAE